jgi:hypothetical protein
MTKEERLKLNIAIENLVQKVKKVQKAHPELLLGECTAPVPEGYVEDDPLRNCGNTVWSGLIEPENSELDKVLYEYLAKLPKVPAEKMAKLTGDNLWVWGGPTPYWGGSMADDTLVRGADYFKADNVVYVYGPTDDKMMNMHSKYKRMLCQINSQCRTPGAQDEFYDADRGADKLRTPEEKYFADAANAEYLSKLSLKYPNIVGAMCDDVSTYFDKIVLPDAFEARYKGLKKYNDKLRMYGVIYVHELGKKDYSLVQPYLDVVNLWYWNKDEILEYDENLELCRQNFPGKPIIQGIFLHEYGRSDIGSPIDLLLYQLDKARENIAKGIVEGVILLGDREIKKWPAVAEALKDYLANQ